MGDEPIRVGLLLYPNLTQLDLTGPAEVFGCAPGFEVHLIWKSLEPVASHRRVRLLPTTTFETCPRLDVICVPGGPGQLALMEDEETLGFLRTAAEDCRLVTSVCTGSLVLAAAGLLSGYRATCHWGSLDQLSLFGVEPAPQRIVRDRNRITGAGVTSGIDFALVVVSELVGEAAAQEVQLQLEYEPEPPFHGSPRTAPPDLVERVRAKSAGFLERRREVSERTAKRLTRTP